MPILPNITTHYPEEAGTDQVWSCYIGGTAHDHVRIHTVVSNDIAVRSVLFIGRTAVGEISF